MGYFHLTPDMTKVLLLGVFVAVALKLLGIY